MDRQCFDEHHSAANVWGGDKFTAEGMRYRTFPLNFTSVDENYIPTLKVQLLFGRNLSKEIPGDESRVFLNETPVEQIRWSLDESAIGKKIQLPGSDLFFEVIGVVKDYNYWTLGNPIEPMAIFHLKNDQLFGGETKRYLVARVDGETSDGWVNTLAQLETTYKKRRANTHLNIRLLIKPSQIRLKVNVTSQKH